MIPQAELRVEFHLTNPPRPICAHVMIDGETIAVISIEELIKAVHDIEVMKRATVKIG